MECPVCYERATNCTLVCGHKFCKQCVKTWYLKGAEASCPMCRKKVHYRRMPVKKWKEEAEAEKKQRVFEESFDMLLEDIMEPLRFVMEIPGSVAPETPGFAQEIEGETLTLHRINVSTRELEELQTTYRAIKDEVDPDELDFILNDTGDYYSDRHINLRKRTYSENCHMYKIARKNIKQKPRIY